MKCPRHNVPCRTQEIGIRMALGAARGILRMPEREALIPAGLGVAIGIPRAPAANHLPTSLEPRRFAAVSGFLAIVAMAAACFPAHKASAVAPRVALRHERAVDLAVRCQAPLTLS
jgi:putative ABC transport system permease protein